MEWSVVTGRASRPRRPRCPGCRRGFGVSVWALLGVVVVLSGCSAAPSTAPTGPVARAAAQDLRVAVGADEFLPGTPPTPNLGLLADGLNPGIFETLTVLTPSFGLRPGLALRWQAQSATSWRFELRPRVRFHDGTPLTAAAVVASLQRLSGGNSTTERGEVPLRSNRPRGLEPDSAAAVDELTVQIALSEPNLRLAEQLADPLTAVQAAGTEAGNGSTPALTPTGTGPFQFVAYRPGVDLQVSGYPAYWDGAPELHSITFRFGADKDASLLLATGQVDAVGYIAAELLANVSDGNDRQVNSAPARAAFMLLNHGGIGPWSTLREDPVRQAVALAVDRTIVADTAWPDYVEPNASLIPAVVLGAAAQDTPPRRPDPAAAEELLDKAGWTLGPDRIRTRDGQRLTLDLLIRQPTDGLPAAADSIGDQLAAVGIATTTADQLPGNPIPLQRVNNATFDLFIDLRPQTDANPCALCRLFTIRPGGDLTVAGVVGAGPAADTLFDQAYAATSPDSARRLAADLLTVVLTDQHLALPLATLPNTWLLSPQVTGFEPAAASGTQQWQNIYLTR